MTTASSERTHATGTINVKKYEPAAYDQPAEGPALVRIPVEEEFSGDIAGSGVAEFLQTARNDSEASFVGVERVTGRVGGRSGSFVFQDAGDAQGRGCVRQLVRRSRLRHRGATRVARRGRLPRRPRAERRDHARLLVRVSGELAGKVRPAEADRTLGRRRPRR